MHELVVIPVESEAERQAFLEFPWKVYRGDRYWVPPLLSERRAFTDPKRSPFFEHARVQYFLARRGAEIVGTIAAFTNDLYNEFHQANVGWFGFFEVMPDPEAAGALLEAAEAWARRAGHETILGPAQFSTNDEIGLLVDGFEDAPRILMTYNPRYYAEYVEAAGFRKAMNLLAYTLDLDMQRIEKARRVAEKIMARGRFEVRPLRMNDYEQEVERVKAVYNRSWERNWGFVPMTDAEIDRMGKQLKELMDPELIGMVELDGQVVGFGLTLPDLNEPLLRAYPRPGQPEFVTLAKLLWHWKVRRRVRMVRVLALGVMPEHRGGGVDALLYLFAMEAGRRKGYAAVEGGWVLEGNEMMNRVMHRFGAKAYKTYRVYQKSL